MEHVNTDQRIMFSIKLCKKLLMVIFMCYSLGMHAQVDSIRGIITSGGGKSDIHTHSNYGILGEVFVMPLAKSEIYNARSGLLNTTNQLTGIRSSFSKMESIRYYPNPASTSIQFEWNQGKALIVELINVSGTLMIKSEIKAEIDISNFRSGIYLLRVLDANGMPVFTDKLVVID